MNRIDKVLAMIRSELTSSSFIMADMPRDIRCDFEDSMLSIRQVLAEAFGEAET